jgi:hypothetical protein
MNVHGFEEGAEERRRELGNDCIAVTAETHHALGNPVSQRECSGLNPAEPI